MSRIRYTDVASPGLAPKANSIQFLIASEGSGFVADGGTVRLKFMGYETPPLAFNTAAPTVGYHLGQLRSVGTVNVTAEGGTLASTVGVEFLAQLGNLNAPMIEISDNLLTDTGDLGPTIAVTAVQPGVTALGRGLSKGTVLSSRATGGIYVQTGEPLDPTWDEVAFE